MSPTSTPIPRAVYGAASRFPGSVLLETTRTDSDNDRSYLFTKPKRILRLDGLEKTSEFFREIDRALGEGNFVAGFLSYECGYAFEPRTRSPSLPLSSPLAWFGVYDRPFVFDHVTGVLEPKIPAQWSDLGAEATDFSLTGCELETPREEYYAKVARVRDLIAAGETYQVNLTTRIAFDFDGSPIGLFSAARDQQRVAYAAFLHLEDCHILSLSPELFFRIKEGRITTRPMKGTARRGWLPEEDAHLYQWLQEDEKNRSENAMIVDLLRNDLSKIAKIGSVEAHSVFRVEPYETLMQMTSTVSAVLRGGVSPYDLLRALFPSGSVTGAPKFRTMQIIQELEGRPRGVYTGAIGFFAPSGDSIFSVSIRTIVLRGHAGEMGVGGGIVFDSVPEREYEECLLKAEFLRRCQPDFSLFETLLWNGGYAHLNLHLERMQASARDLGFPYDDTRARRALEEARQGLKAGESYKVRLALDRKGTFSSTSVLLDSRPERGTITLSPIRISSGDVLLRHKTTRRALYDRLHREARALGHEDVIFQNERGELTEGAIHNLFVEISGKLFTPPIECGLLPGVFRRQLLATDPRVVERVLRADDLLGADSIFMGNSVRGLRLVRLADPVVAGGVVPESSGYTRE